MSESEAFERLLRKSLQSHDLPPVPATILRTWQLRRTEPAAPWLWIMPLAVFMIGIGTGVVLAPLGLTTAYDAVRQALAGVWHALPRNAWAWAFALLAGVALLALDAMRSRLRRR